MCQLQNWSVRQLAERTQSMLYELPPPLRIKGDLGDPSRSHRDPQRTGSRNKA